MTEKAAAEGNCRDSTLRTNVISRENRSKRGVFFCAPRDGTLFLFFSVLHVELHRRQRAFPERAATIVRGNRTKFQRHVAHRARKISYFSPPPPSKKGEQLTIRLVWQTSVASYTYIYIYISHCRRRDPKFSGPGNVIFNGRPITIFLTSYVRT